MQELRTEIDINASVESVWAILIATDLYSEWNPFITSFNGRLAVGSKLKVRMEPPRGKPMTFHPTCLERTEYRRLRWLGSLGIKGLFDGEHVFELEPVGENHTHFIQREKFTGILVSILWKQIASNTRLGFEAMNQKLKSRAEGLGQ